MRALFAFTQPGQCHWVTCITDQMEAANPFECQNFTTPYTVHCLLQRVPVRQSLSGCSLKPDGRPAVIAGVGLRMKTSILGAVVLLPARQTGREPTHAGVAAIIRQLSQNTETWPAVCAVYKGVAPAPISGIKQLRQTVMA